MDIRLSVLDQSPVVEGCTPADALAATIDLAQAADALGYTRYWCAEHHGMQAVCNTAPEVLLARLGASTRRIRIGSGGVMLPYYSPYKVAEQFSMLEALYPGRIDLGVGRAPGGTLSAARAVSSGRYDPDEFPAQVAELVRLFAPAQAARDMLGPRLQPAVPTRPQLWMLGSSDFGGAVAADYGLRFAFAHFISAHGGDAVARAYREEFQPLHEPTPYCAVALFVICADDEAQAQRLAAAVDLRRVQMAYGADGPIPSLETAAAWQPDERAQAVIERERPRSIIGTPQQVVERMLALKERFDADEIVVLTVAATYAARMRSYELLAEAFALPR